MADDVHCGRCCSWAKRTASRSPRSKAARLARTVSTLRRSLQLPDLPTVVESGFPDFEVTVWCGVCTQASIPKPILAKLSASLVRTLNLPEMKARLGRENAGI